MDITMLRERARHKDDQRRRGLMMQWNDDNGLPLTDGLRNCNNDQNADRKLWVDEQIGITDSSIPNDEAGPKSKIWSNNQDRRDPPPGSSAISVFGGKTRRRYKKKSRGGYKKKSRGGYKKKSRRGRK